MATTTDLYKHSLALLTDLYELTMAYGYWKEGVSDKEAVFHLIFRSNPFHGGYAGPRPVSRRPGRSPSGTPARRSAASAVAAASVSRASAAISPGASLRIRMTPSISW